jgi:hypothetical protein
MRAAALDETPCRRQWWPASAGSED